MGKKKINAIVYDFLVNTSQRAMIKPMFTHDIKQLIHKLRVLRGFSYMYDLDGINVHLSDQEMSYLIGVLEGINYDK